MPMVINRIKNTTGPVVLVSQRVQHTIPLEKEWGQKSGAKP